MAIKIEHRIGLSVPASIVWEILADVPRWPQWTTIYPKAAGRIGYGEKLSLTLALPGQAHQQISPRILDWAPEEAIHWKLPIYGGLGSAVRYLEIDSLTDTGCVFSNGELINGLGARFVSREMRKSMRQGFTALGEALKVRADALWRERAGGAT